MNRSTRWQYLTAVLAFVGAGLGCTPPEQPQRPVIPRVKVFEVGREAPGQMRTISGQLVAADRSPLSFGVSGTTDLVNVAVGDTVEEGQILATLDSEPLRIQLESARAKLAGARAKSMEAGQAFERATVLVKQRAVSEAEVEAAAAAFRSARASVDGALSDVESAERDMKRAVLLAPFAGRIAERSIDPFQDTDATSAAFVLHGERALKVQVQVPEVLIRNVDYADAVRVSFPTVSDSELVGVVMLIGAEAGTGNAFPVEIQLPDSKADLRPGMAARVTFNFDSYLDGKTAYLIPVSAIAIDAGLAHGDRAADGRAPVFVYDEATGRLRETQVLLGELRSNQLEVYEGLKPGDKVVSAGVAFLRDGMEVELWSPELGLTDG